MDGDAGILDIGVNKVKKFILLISLTVGFSKFNQTKVDELCQSEWDLKSDEAPIS